MNCNKIYTDNIVIVFIIITIFLSIFNDSYSSNRQKRGNKKNLGQWTLIWKDEFNDSIIDSTKWMFEVNAWGGGNNELQYYTERPQNAFVKNGCLIIQANKEVIEGPEGKREYTSARLVTKNKYRWKYGKFEIRAKLPKGQGIWPAIWMLPVDTIYGGWAASGEIDILECIGSSPNKIFGTIHYGDRWPRNCNSGSNISLETGDFSDDFHTFRFEWEKKEMRWYVDDFMYFIADKWFSKHHKFPAPFNQPFYLILNVAVGGNWPGNPDINTKFPQQLVIDYIRIYK